MGVGQSLRKAVGYFGGGDQDEYDDERYEHYEDHAEEHDGAHTLVLVRQTSRDFFLAVPHAFDDVESIGNRLKSSVPVIVDVHARDRALIERVVDFCAGLAYALDGNMYRIGESILLLTPKGVDLSSESGAEVFRYRCFD
ncbi:MAG: cell division protein SepF [Thermoleophilia bacterium]